MKKAVEIEPHGETREAWRSTNAVDLPGKEVGLEATVSLVPI